MNIREKIKALYDEGLNNSEIAKELGKGKSTITYYMKDMGLQSNCNNTLRIKDRFTDTQYKYMLEQIQKKVNKISFRKIAKELNISSATLHTIIKNENIEIIVTKNIMNAKRNKMSLKEREKLFADNLHLKDKTKIYHHGFKTIDSKVFIKCLRCNAIYEINANLVRSNHKNIYCQSCEDIKKEQRKEQIEKNKIIEHNKKKQIIKANRLLQSIQLEMTSCKNCGTLFIKDFKHRDFCNDKCRSRFYNKYRDKTRRKRMKENGNVDYTITLEKLIKRDKNICYICNKECNLEDYTYVGDNFVAGNYYPSIDHVKPLAKKGTHSWDNVKLAHRICNSIKKDNI